MTYHDDFVPYIDVLSLEQWGRLFVSLLKYSAYDENPDFTDDVVLKVIWTTVKKGLERDSERYKERCSRAKYAVYCRETKKAGSPVMSYEKWQETSAYFDIR